MFIERLEVTGFGGLRSFDAPMDRVTRIDGPPRALTALGDALLLAFAGWDASALATLLARWGCVNPTIEGTPLPEAAHWDAAPGLGAVVDRGAEGLLTVGLTLGVDPPQYRKLRTLAARDPRLVDALAEGARLTVRVGARFSPSMDAVGIDPLAFLIGDEAFPIAGADRPPWMTPFLRGLCGRLWRGPCPHRRWGDAARSWAPDDQHALRRALAALGQAPASLGDAVALPEGPAVLEDGAVVPVWHLGPPAEQAAGLVGAVHLSGAEILVVERPPEAWLDWLAAAAEAEGSPLEQVLLLGVPGGVVVA